MSLSTFIRSQQDEIISEFAVFAKTLMPSGADMTEAELRDHAAEILSAVVRDIGTPQTVEEQSLKSQGHGSAHAMRPLESFMPMIASSTASPFGRYSRSFARSGRQSCDSMKKRERRILPTCADSMRPLTRL